VQLPSLFIYLEISVDFQGVPSEITGDFAMVNENLRLNCSLISCEIVV